MGTASPSSNKDRYTELHPGGIQGTYGGASSPFSCLLPWQVVGGGWGPLLLGSLSRWLLCLGCLFFCGGIRSLAGRRAACPQTTVLGFFVSIITVIVPALIVAPVVIAFLAILTPTALSITTVLSVTTILSITIR